MFLITRPIAESNELIALLADKGIVATHLPLMSIVPCQKFSLGDIDAIKKAKVVFITSPTTVTYAQELIQLLANNVQVIAAGQSSATRVHDVNPNLKVISHAMAGVQEIIATGVFNDVSEILILGGNEPNEKLIKYCEEQQIKYYFICAYQRVDLIALNKLEIENTIFANQLSGVVITSSHLAKLIIALMEESSLLKNKLQTTLFISIHSNITRVLHDYGLNVRTTASSDNASIVKLIMELEYEQKHSSK